MGMFAYIKAGQSVWPPALNEFRASWLIFVVFLVCTMTVAALKKYKVAFVLWSFLAALVSFGIEHYIGRGVREFLTNPSPDALRRVWEFAGVLLMIVFAWIVSIPHGKLSNSSLRIRAAVNLLPVIVGLGLSLSFAKASSIGIHGLYPNPESQVGFFRYRFQEMGIVLLLVLFLRLVLPTTVIYLTEIFSGTVSVSTTESLGAGPHIAPKF